MTDTYQDIAALKVEGEDLVGPIQDKDYVEYKTQEPGNYINQSRTITATKYDDGNYGFRLSFTSGLIHKETGKHFPGGKFPLAKTVTTRLYETEKGKTSSVAEYLKKVGLFSLGMNLSDIKDAMLESSAVPVGLFISRTDKGVKDEETGQWTNKGLKLKDFNLGTKEEPIWAETVEIEGVLYKAKAIVGSFSKAA